MGAEQDRAQRREAAALDGDERLYLTEVAATLAAWPARNPVARRALDLACDEVLALAALANR